MSDRSNHHPPVSARSKYSSNTEYHRVPFMFEPTKNFHLWTMWRIGNTEKIIKFTQNKTHKDENEMESQYGIFSGTPYGSPTLLVPPLARNISITGTTRQKANKMMSMKRGEPQSELNTGQFIYFGLPRVVLYSDRTESDINHSDTQGK